MQIDPRFLTGKCETLFSTSSHQTMTYKGYMARIAYSDADACFIGHLTGIQDIVGFHGTTVTELQTAFEEAVDDYLETCDKLEHPPC